MAGRSDELPRVGGTDAGSYREVAPDVLVAVPRPGYVQTVEGARESLKEMNRIARERGRRQVLLVLVDRVVSQDAGSRKVWQQEMDAECICALGLVCESLLARAIGSFFIGLRRPVVETRMLSSMDAALAWAEEELRVRGGPIDGTGV